MNSRWFRFYDEALDDPKVQRLAPHLFKTWVNILCVASRQGGAIPSDDDIAFKLRMSAKDAAEQIQDLILAGLIDVTPNGTRVAHNWEIRQRRSDKSNERVTKHRKKQKETHCNVTGNSTRNVDVTDQIRKEEIRKEEVQSRATASATPLPDRMVDRMKEAAQPCLENDVNAMGLLTEATPLMWIEQGCDFERDVLPTLRAAAIKYKGKRISSWTYFNGMVNEAKAKRLAGLPAIDLKKPKDNSYTPAPRRREMTDADRERIALEYAN